ncbi:MAG: adenylosuccinate lyase [Archaeoglobus sp.]|jgi:adenylosuccinate lyase|nr:MAG: adenylosuccinate lyase [Archaeoglobus sp.]
MDAVHPIDYRYGTEEMKSIWSERSKINRMISVEIALLKALARRGYLSEEEVKKAEKAALNITPERVKAIEAEIKHDVMALVRAISEEVGKVSPEAARWIHFGATSNDITDTATATQLRDSLKLLGTKISRLALALTEKAIKHKNTICLGRTHGQAALPTTYGFRFALWAAEVARYLERLEELKPRLIVGQLSGAVGSQAAFGEDGINIEREVMKELGLKPALISSQIIPRDHYCEYLSFLANLSATLEKIATNIRILQRVEVSELMESFGEKQVGSSTMPHKKNPIDCENVCGLARVIRGFVEPQRQSSILWEERDLTNSSCERITLVESSVLADHILTKMIKVVERLEVNEERAKENLRRLMGLNLSEAVMVALTKKGMNRQEAHERVRMAAMKAYGGKSFEESLLEDEKISKLLSAEEIRELLTPENYLGTVKVKIENVKNYVEKLCSKYQNER